MGVLPWSGMFAGGSLLALWVLHWGGAEWLEGWKSLLLIDSGGRLWEAPQITLYFLCLWLIYTLWFFAGVFVPQWRGLP